MPKPRSGWKRVKQAKPSDLVIRSDLPLWIVRVLRENGVRRLSVISALSDEELLGIPGIGRRSVEIIRSEIERRDQTAAPSASVSPADN